MSKVIIQSPMDRPIEDKGLKDVVEREIMPFLRRARGVINSLRTVSADLVGTEATVSLTADGPDTCIFQSVFTQTITVTLVTSPTPTNGKIRVVRAASATGAFDLDVGGLKTLAAGTWCDVASQSGAWVLVAYGSL